MWLELKYINLVSSRLQQFTRKSDTVWNFRCPYCGDSKTNKRKARGYFFEHKSAIIYKCQNCQVSTGFPQFLNHLDSALYSEYRLESIKEAGTIVNTPTIIDPVETPATKFDPAFKYFTHSPLAKLEKISSLHPMHKAKLYIEKRMIPAQYHYKLYYTDNFQEWVNTFIPGKFPRPPEKDERIVIPMLDAKKRFFGCAGRALNENQERYYVVIINKDVNRVFGLEDLDINKHIYVVEGAFDSYFLENSIAMGGVSLVRFTPPDKSKVTIILDNDPRNPDVVRRVKELIQDDYRVFIWPSHIDSKDINDWYLQCRNQAEIKLTIDNNTFSGLIAFAKWQQWKK